MIPLPPPDADLDPQILTPETLLWAYRNGLFPMADPGTSLIEWFSPDPRGVIPLETFHVPGNLGREVRGGRFEIRSDTAFDAVIRACAQPRPDDDLSWIDRRMIEAYTTLQRLGHAHSVEAWLEGDLVGGLYGVHIGAAFFGESMFSHPDRGGTNASKVCLVHLVDRLRRGGFLLLDTQFWTEHLDQFGCIEIDRAQYLTTLARAVAQEGRWEEEGLEA